MSERINVEDLEFLLKANDEQGGKLRKEMAETASKEADYWNNIVKVLGGSVKSRRAGPRNKPADGLTHGEAILAALQGSKEPMGTKDLLSALAESGHEMSGPTFYQTMAKLVENKQVKKAKIDKGKRDNVYSAK